MARSELLGVRPCRADEDRHNWWCFRLGECQPRPALLDEVGEIAWSGTPQWGRSVETVTVAHRDVL